LEFTDILVRMTTQKNIYAELTSSIQQAAEKAKSEFNLKGSEDRLKQLTENLHIWIWEVDSTGLYTYSSPAVENMLGLNLKKL